MDINKKTKITNHRQFSRMVSLLEQNPSLAKGFNSGINKINAKEEWNKIGEELNILGPPARNGEGWMKVWADYKFKIKKKLIFNKAECCATGGGSFKQYVLSPTEEAASNLLQIDSIVNPGGVSFGFQRRRQNTNSGNNEDIPMSDDLENEEPVCSNQSTNPKQHNNVPKEVRALHSTQKTATQIPMQNNEVVEEVRFSVSKKKTPTKKPTQILGEQSSTPPTKKTPTKKKTKDNLLEEQLEVQTALYTEVKHSLAEIERYQRKNYKIKEEKLALYKKELKCKDEFRIEFLKLRKQEIEFEKRRIAIDEMRNGLQSIELDESL